MAVNCDRSVARSSDLWCLSELDDGPGWNRATATAVFRARCPRSVPPGKSVIVRVQPVKGARASDDWGPADCDGRLHQRLLGGEHEKEKLQVEVPRMHVEGWLLLSQQSRLKHTRSVSCTLRRGAEMVLYEPVAIMALPGQPRSLKSTCVELAILRLPVIAVRVHGCMSGAT
jgi:hypothetical protein